MKNVYYFSHDGNARNDDKIMMLRTKFGWEGYGIYWVLIETMFESKETCLYHNKVTGLSACYNIDITLLENIIKAATAEGLFISDGEKFFSESLRRRKQIFQDLQEKHSKGGKKGMLHRWGKKVDTITSNNSLITRKGKERKVKEIKDINTKDLSVKKLTDPRIKEIIDYFFQAYQEKFKRKYMVTPKDPTLAKQLLSYGELPEIKLLIKKFLSLNDDFIKKAGYTFGVFFSQFNKLAAQNHIAELDDDEGSAT